MDKYKHRQNCIQYSVGYMANFLREILKEWSKLKTFWHALSVCKFIEKCTTEELTNIPEITDESFFLWPFPSMSSLVKYLPKDCECKYRQKAPSIKLCKLIVYVRRFFSSFGLFNWAWTKVLDFSCHQVHPVPSNVLRFHCFCCSLGPAF